MFDKLEAMYQLLWEFIYKVLEIFGYTKDEDGNIVEAE